MSFFIIGLIVLMVFLFVMEPFISGRKFPNRFISKKQLREKDLQTKREHNMQSIADLDLDNAIEKIPKEDYFTLRKAYVTRLENITRELDGLSKGGRSVDVKKQIENEVLVRRKSQKTAAPKSNGRVCSSCSGVNSPESNFCSTCGAKLAIQKPV